MRNQRSTVLSAAAILAMVGTSALADELIVPSVAFPSISAAVAAAEAGDEIVLLDGELTGPANWDVTIDLPLTIRGASGDPALVTVRGPNDIARALLIRSAGVRVESVTFTEFVRLEGGAVSVDGGEADFEGVRFVGNAASSVDFPEPALGGAVYVRGGTARFERCVFQNNIAAPLPFVGTGTAAGGAISVRSGTAEFRDCAFQGNRARGVDVGAGGAIHAAGDASIRIEDCTFTNNLVTGTDTLSGGAISIGGRSSLEMIGGRVSNSRLGDVFGTTSARGGGVLIDSTSRAVISGVRFEGNSTAASFNALGGAICVFNTATLSNVIFERNTATAGFGACAVDENGLGGAIYVRGRLTLAHATLRGNTSSCQNAIYAEGTTNASIVGSILRDPFPIEVASGGVVEVAYSNVLGGYPGEGNIDAAPLFDADLRLLPGSAGIDAASTALLPADALDVDGDGNTTEPLPLDLESAPRRADDPATPDTGMGPAPLPDMGAYELGVACPADFDGDGELTLFDFLAFQNAFDAGDLAADFDGDGELTLFDFLAFQNAFDAGCE